MNLKIHKRLINVVSEPKIRKRCCLFIFLISCSLLTTIDLFAQTPSDLGDVTAREILIEFDEEISHLEDLMKTSSRFQSQFYSYLTEAYAQAAIDFENGGDLRDELADVIMGIERDYVTNFSNNSHETSAKSELKNDDIVNSILDGKEITASDYSDLLIIFHEILNLNQ